MRLQAIFVLILTIALVPGCEKKSTSPPRTSGGLPVVDVQEDDADMTAAIEKARNTVDKFVTAMENPTPQQDGFSIKLLVEEGPKGEPMWLSPVRLEGDEFVGVLNNEPLELKNVKIGDELRVPKSEISDWMYLDGGKMAGAYTLRVLMEKATPEERAAMPGGMEFIDD